MNINKQELVNKIHTIDSLSADEKSALVELLNTRKKYGLVWEDKPEVVEERMALLSISGKNYKKIKVTHLI